MADRRRRELSEHQVYIFDFLEYMRRRLKMSPDYKKHELHFLHEVICLRRTVRDRPKNQRYPIPLELVERAIKEAEHHPVRFYHHYLSRRCAYMIHHGEYGSHDLAQRRQTGFIERPVRANIHFAVPGNKNLWRGTARRKRPPVAS